MCQYDTVKIPLSCLLQDGAIEAKKMLHQPHHSAHCFRHETADKSFNLFEFFFVVNVVYHFNYSDNYDRHNFIHYVYDSRTNKYKHHNGTDNDQYQYDVGFYFKYNLLNHADNNGTNDVK